MSRRGYADGRRRGIVHPRGVFNDRAHATPADVAQVLRIIDRSETPDWIASWRAEDRAAEGRKPGGRPPMLGDRGVLALLLLLGLISQPQTVRAMTALVMWGLDGKSRELLGIDLADLTPDDLYHRLWRSFHRTLRTLEPHPISTYRRLSTAEFKLARAAISPEFEECRKDRLVKVSNRLVWSSTMELPREVRRRWKGNTVVDGTAIKANARKPSYDWASADESAGFYRLRGNHGLSEEAVKKLPKADQRKLGGFLWAHEATLLLAATNDPAREMTFPQLVVGMTLDKPAEDPGGHAVKALREMQANGMPAGYLVGDRAYGFAPKLENYSGPARELGYKVLFDLTEPELGKVRYVDGMVLLEGNLYCPTITAHPKLINATRDLRFGDPDKDGTTISWDDFDERIAARAKFLVQFKERPRPDGTSRVSCPASGPRPTMACPLREQPESTKVVGLWPVMRADLPPEELRGGVCSNAGGSVTVQPSETIPRYVQDMQFGTKQWGRLFQVLRQSIESMNAQLKNAAKGDARASERRRVRGLAAATLFVASLVVGVNLRKIAAFMAGPVPSVDDRGRGALRERPRRRRADDTYRAGSRLYRTAPPSAGPPGRAA